VDAADFSPPEATLFSPQRTLLPETLTPANYLRLFTKTTFTVNLLHSLVVALGTVVVGLALSLTAAYAFSRFRFAGRRLLMMTFLLINMFPLILLIIRCSSRCACSASSIRTSR